MLVALVATVLGGLLTVGMWASTRTARPTAWTHPGAGMMGGGYGLAGDGARVDSLAAARQRAQRFADGLGLRPGEVIQFSNGFYAELLTGDGQGATEVLIDPADGTVGLELGPAMMWNTRYGMHAGAGGPGPGAGDRAATVSAGDAAQVAQRWLDTNRHGLTVGDAEHFPGYYTFEVVRGGTVAGMMSVHDGTGAVWYHTWHGTFVAASEE